MNHLFTELPFRKNIRLHLSPKKTHRNVFGKITGLPCKIVLGLKFIMTYIMR